jgi:hypothetical protein
MSPSNGSPRKRFPSYARVARPDLRYSVQAAFIGQKQRIYLIDPNSNTYINGLINTPSVYLTTTPPGEQIKMVRKRLGFVPNPPEEIIMVEDSLKVDATLYFSYPDHELFSGYDEKTDLTIMVIQVWHDFEIPKWRKIAQKVATELAIVRRNERFPTVAFNITSAYFPFDPYEPRQLIIKQNNGDENFTSAVSKTPLKKT